MLRPAGYRTPTKTRILAGGIHSAKQQVVRIDRAASSTVDDTTRLAFESRVLRAVRGADALLVSDYGSGLVRPRLVTEARKIFRLKAEATRATHLVSRSQKASSSSTPATTCSSSAA